MPEHKVQIKPYNVTLIVNENDSEIISFKCYDCAALAGGRKHAVAFLMWVNRRSEEPACTSVECYWRESTLFRVGTTLKYITVDQFVNSLRRLHESKAFEFYSVGCKEVIYTYVPWRGVTLQ